MRLGERVSGRKVVETVGRRRDALAGVGGWFGAGKESISARKKRTSSGVREIFPNWTASMSFAASGPFR